MMIVATAFQISSKRSKTCTVTEFIISNSPSRYRPVLVMYDGEPMSVEIVASDGKHQINL